MNYFDPSTGGILTYEQIVAEAGTIPVAEYMLQKGYQELGDDFTSPGNEPDITVEEVNFQPAAATETDASVVAIDPMASNDMGLGPGDGSLESLTKKYNPEELYKELKEAKKALAELEVANGRNLGGGGMVALSKVAAQFNAAENRIKSATEKIKQSDMNQNVPETLIEKGDEELIGFLRENYPGIVFENNSSFLDDTISFRANGEDIKLDINPISDKGEKQFYENYNKLLEYDKAVKANDVAQQGAFSNIMNAFDSGAINAEDVNERLEKTGYTFEPILSDLGATVGYELMQDGKVVATDNFLDQAIYTQSKGKKGETNNIEDYISSSFTTQETSDAFGTLYPLFSSHLKNLSIEENERIEKVNSTPDEKLFNYDSFSEIFGKLKDVDKLDFTELERKAIQYMLSISNPDLIEERGEDKLTIFGYQEDVDSRITLNAEQQLEYVRDLQGFDDANLGMFEGLDVDLLKEKLQTNNLWSNAVDYSIKAKREESIAIAKQTAAESIMYGYDRREREFIRISQLGQQAGYDKIKDEILADKEVIQNYNNTTSSIINGELQRIVNKLGDMPAKLDYIKTTGVDDSLFFSLKPSGDLTPEQQVGFDEAKLDIFNLQKTLSRLDSDYTKTVQNYVGHVSDAQQYKDSLNVVVGQDDKGKDIVKNGLTEFSNIFKEYGVGNLVAKDFTDATYGILLAIPTLVNSDWAIEEQKALQRKEEYYKTALAYDDAWGEGEFGLYSLRTLSQQAPNIILAIGTGAAGNAIGLGASAAQWSIASTFGITSGTDMYRTLSTQADLLTAAEDQRDFLNKMWEAGRIDQFDYTQGLLDAEKTIAMGSMTPFQIASASVATGIIEGGVTRYIGSASNTFKFLKDVKGQGQINIYNLFNKPSLNAWGSFIGEGAKRIGGELVEENTIYGLTQGISEAAILQRDADWSQFDDTTLATLITAGMANTSGIATSAMTQMAATKNFKEKINKATSEIQEMVTLMNGPGVTESQREIFTVAIKEKLIEIGMEQNSLGVDVIALGADQVTSLVGLNVLKNTLYEQAGVTPDMTAEQAQQQLDKYKEAELTTEEAERFDQNLNSVESNINSVKEGPKNYDRVEELLGDAGKKARENLDNNTPEWNGKLDRRQELAAVIDEMHRITNESYVNKAKADPNIENEWNEVKSKGDEKYIGPRPKGELDSQKENFYRIKGKQLFAQDNRIITTSTDIDYKADMLLTKENVNNLQIIEIPEVDDQISYLYDLVEQGKLPFDAVAGIKEGLEEGGNGFIVDNQYIVTDKKAAEEALLNGDIRAGVVTYHEIGHAIDNTYFETPEQFNKYAESLYNAVSNSSNLSLVALHNEVEGALTNPDSPYYDDATDKDGNLLPFASRSDTYKDEYTKEMQSLSYAYEKELKLEDKYGTESILSKLSNRIGVGLKVNTPEQALSYMIGNNAAFRRGEFTSQVRAKIGKEGIKTTKGKQSSLSIAGTINKKFENDTNFTPITPKQVDDMVGKVSSRAWSKFGKGVPLNIRDQFDLTRKRYIDHAKSKMQEIALGWNPAKATFAAYMANTGMQRANAFATELGIPKGRVNVRTDVAGLELQSDQTSSEDLNRRAETEATEVTPALKNKLKGKNIPDLVSKINKKLKKEIKYKLPKYNADTTTKQKTDFVKELGKGMQVSFKDVIDSMGARNKTIDQYETFLNENYTSLLGPNGLTTTYLSKAFPQAIEKYVNGMGWVKYDKWKGRKKGTGKGEIDFYNSTELGPMAGSTAGNQKIRRVKDIKNAIPLAKFKSKYIQLDGKNLKIPQMPTEALAKQIAQEIGLDIFNEEIQDVDSDIRNEFVERQKLFGADILDNYVEQLMYDVSRPSIKNQLALFSDPQRTNWLGNRFRFYEEVKKIDLQSLNSTQITSKLKSAHKGVYGDTFTDEEHLGVAKQFGKLLTPQTKTGVLQTEQEWVDYLETVITNVDNIENVIAYTKADQAVATSLRSSSNMVEARDFVEKTLYPALVEKHGKVKALDLMVAFMPASFSNGTTIFGDFIATENNELIGGQRPNKTPRAGVFGDMKDKTRLIQRIDEGVVSIDRQVIKFNDGRPDRKVDINTSADVQMQYLNGKFENSQELQDQNKVDADLAWEFFIEFMKSLKKSGLDNNTTALLMGVMNGSSNSALRLAAPVWGRSTILPYSTLKIPKVRNGKLVKKSNGEQEYEPAYRYEHAIPARAVLFFAYESIFNGNKEIDLDLLKEDYRVTIIPVKEMDDVLGNTGFTQSMLIGYQPGKQEWWKRYYNIFTKGKMPFGLQSYESGDVVGQEFEDFYNETNGTPGVSLDAQQVIDKNNNADIAMEAARNSIEYSRKIRKIRIFDFDDTLAQSNSMVIVNMPDGTTSKINATTFAKDAARLEAEGAEFDFTEFSKVVEGRKGPLFDVAKKIQDVRGSEDIFVLTARPQNAARPIQEFLASIGLNIPIQNITGLADGKAQAKADWVINKFAEGYNDFYFTDDAVKNVKAVKDALDVLDVKSKVQIARIQFQKDLDFEFNKMIERNKGVEVNKRYSEVVAQRLGKNKRRFNLFIPPSADDFRGLTMYMFAGKGKQGELDQDFFDKALIKPYTSGINAIELAKQRVSNDYTALMSNFPKLKKILRKKITGQQYTYDEAVRVYLWDKQGASIPGISKRDQANLARIVREDPNLQSFADGVLLITKKDSYIDPPNYWQGQTIIGDLNTITTKVNRSEYIKEFITNVDIIFSEQNLIKIEAVYGSRVRESIENSIFRMKNGTNRTSGNDRQTNMWYNWLNRSIGAIMFFNRRSAILQLISSVNFINWSDNNPFMAGKAFANQTQYWSDVVMLFNSSKLKQRRAGLKGDVNEAEIAAAVKGSKNKMGTFISILLRNGFVFTQVADSVAIATGGATFYRNRINTYKKQGLDQAEAEKRAFQDFSNTAEESQQSADPMMISQQQAGFLGRFILSFQNTPMQYTRLMKKAGLDIINGRGDLKTNISKIAYYGFVQNLIFSVLQNSLFALIPGFDEPDDELTEEQQLERYNQVLSKKEDRIINGMVDTILRGSGVAGAVISTIKNAIRRYNYEEEKGFTADHTYTILELANLSPALGSKLRKIYSAIQTRKFEKDVIAEKGFSVTIDGRFQLSPAYQVVGDVASGAANIPLDRLVAEINAITEAFDSRNTNYQRIALALGYRNWDVNAKIEEFDLIKVEGKVRRKEEGKIKAKETRQRKKEEKARLRKIQQDKYEAMSPADKLEYDLQKDKELQDRIDGALKNALEKIDKLYGTD